MNVEALKSNPLFAQSIARQIDIQKSEEVASINETQTVQYASKTTSGANFVQKIKGTNEAIGFISTASKGIEALKIAAQTSDAQGIINTASKVSFNGRGILEPQAFDTTAGIVTIDLGLGLGNLDLHGAQGKDELMGRLNGATERLSEAKKTLSTPINKAQKEQETKLANMDMSGSDFLRKLSSAMDKQNQIQTQPKGIDALEAKLNEIGNKIF